MPITIRLPADRSAGLLPVLSPLAELFAALHVLANPGHHPFLAGWTDRIHSAIPAPLARELDVLAFLWEGGANVFLLNGPRVKPIRSLHDELASLAALDPDAFAIEALQPLGSRMGEPVPADAITRYGDDRLRAHARARSRGSEATVSQLLADPETVRDQLAAVLADLGDAFFEREWQALQPSLHQAADAAGRILATKGSVALMTGLSPGIRRHRDREISIDKSWDAEITVEAHRPILLVPSLLCHPHLTVQASPPWPTAIQYPVNRLTPTGELPPLATTEQRLEALANSSRRDLVAMLAVKDRSTQELADLSGLTTPTVSRHLTVLRDAGLVSVRQQGHFRIHHLDLDAVSGVGHALVASILR